MLIVDVVLPQKHGVFLHEGAVQTTKVVSSYNSPVRSIVSMAEMSFYESMNSKNNHETVFRIEKLQCCFKDYNFSAMPSGFLHSQNQL